MSRRRAGAAVLWGVALAVATTACEEPVAPPSPAATATVTAPAVTTQPATASTAPAAATAPASSVMLIGGRSTLFPPARLRIETDGQRLVALCFSDDPRDALKDNYTGNSFYLRMELDIDDPAQLGDATWRYAAPSGSEREDSPYGIYLGGRKVQLAPFQVMGRFKVGGGETPGQTSVLFSGQFKLVDDATRRGPAQLVTVAAEMPVKVDADVERKKAAAD